MAYAAVARSSVDVPPLANHLHSGDPCSSVWTAERPHTQTVHWWNVGARRHRRDSQWTARHGLHTRPRVRSVEQVPLAHGRTCSPCVYDEADDMLSRDFTTTRSTTSPKPCLQMFKCVPSLPWRWRVYISPRSSCVARCAYTVKRHELTLEGLRLLCVSVEKEERKLDTPCDLYETFTITQIILVHAGSLESAAPLAVSVKQWRL